MQRHTGAGLWRWRRGTGVSDALEFRQKESPDMKHLISSVTIGACLLLSSAGHVFAQPATNNPHGSAVAGVGGQLGTGSSTGVAGCGFGQPSPLGHQGLNTTNSPFPTGNPPAPPNQTGAVSKYAGAGDGSYGANSPAAPNVNSQYDNACYRAGLHAGTIQLP